MQSRFPAPARATRIRFFSSASSLLKAVPAHSAYVLLDSGVPVPRSWESKKIFRVGGGEGGKRWQELERVLLWLAENKAQRSQPLVVIGGGAVLDLGAFAASLYRRGMPLVLVPTTLLSMCDATLGGKTAVDAEISGRLVKNFAGTFYPAQAVWISMEFLRSLPERERLSGAGEVLKTLWIRGKSWDREALADFVRDAKISKSLGHLVRDCLVLKSKVVERDPLDEKRIREVLNFGHTVGHALEALSDLSHGECVLWGMAVESSLLGSRGAQMLGECAWAIREFGLAFPQQFKSVSREEWIGLLAGDKKSKGGAIEMSLLERPGRVVKKRFAPDRIVQAIKDFPKSFPLEGRHQRE